MRIPIYQTVAIRSADKLEVYHQLSQLELGKQPYALDLRQLDQQQHVLEMIEDYISEKECALVPYPTVILATGEVNSGFLDVCQSLKNAPQFFNQKSKSLNNREQDALTELELRQKNLENLRPKDYNPSLKKYSLATEEFLSLRERIISMKVYFMTARIKNESKE